ncbi:MAG TPA: hypothetical protein PKA63_09595 [Oligoflexia bacterium]|nr:hypothetical protein [Oligoflexia bacterium]HMP48907.1 hypothetical protein [Oligoflexia bacterium]
MCCCTRFEALSLKSLSQKLMVILRLTPDWFRGHYYLGIVSYFQCQTDRSGLFRARVTESFNVCSINPSLNNEAMLLEILANFLERKFEEIVSKIKEPEWEIAIKSLKKHEKFLLIEVAGSAYLALDKKDEAIRLFHKIPQEFRNAEIRAIISVSN